MTRFLPVALALLLAPAALAQDVLERVDAFLTAAHEAGQFDGSALVARGDEIAYERGFGQAERSWGIPNAPDTRHRIGSVTKQFTAALVLQLVEAGEIELDAPITRYLPDYPAAQGAVTVHQLLSHTGGIPEHTNRPDFVDIMRDPVAPEAFLEVFSGEPLDFEPGSAYRYSNSGYFLLGVIIERVTGQPYAEALRQRLLEPLGLSDTVYQDNTTVLDRMASGYDRVGADVRHTAYIDTGIPYAAGMMVSTVRDLHTWTRALHAARPFESAETLTRMTTPVMNSYAYGIDNSMMPMGGKMVRAIGHSGGIPGFRSMLIYFPESEETVALISNTSDEAGALARSVGQILHGGDVPLPTRPLALTLSEIIETDGVDAALARAREARASGERFDENQLNQVGYALLGEGEVESAIRVFALNVELFPDAANPYDSLGEAYVAARDPENASANYLRSLELDPSNDNAREMLRRIGVEPPEAEAVALTPEALEPLVGRYALAPTFVIEITREGTQLYGQPTGQPRVALTPLTATRFEVVGVDAQVSFTLEGAGPATTLTLHQNGRNQPGARVE